MTPKTPPPPPHTAMSSPMQKTAGSRSHLLAQRLVERRGVGDQAIGRVRGSRFGRRAGRSAGIGVDVIARLRRARAPARPRRRRRPPRWRLLLDGDRSARRVVEEACGRQARRKAAIGSRACHAAPRPRPVVLRVADVVAIEAVAGGDHERRAFARPRAIDRRRTASYVATTSIPSTVTPGNPNASGPVGRFVRERVERPDCIDIAYRCPRRRRRPAADGSPRSWRSRGTRPG